MISVLKILGLLVMWLGELLINGTSVVFETSDLEFQLLGGLVVILECVKEWNPWLSRGVLSILATELKILIANIKIWSIVRKETSFWAVFGFYIL